MITIDNLLAFVAGAAAIVLLHDAITWIYSAPPCQETTSITGTPGGGEILLRKGETSEPFCFLVGQVTTSGPSADAAGRGRMFFARTCDEEMKWKR